jgi:hypothetical protein
MMNQYATNNNSSQSAAHELNCSLAHAVGYDHGLRGNKGLPRTMLVNGLFLSRNSICGAGVDLRIGHKAGYAAYLAKKEGKR